MGRNHAIGGRGKIHPLMADAMPEPRLPRNVGPRSRRSILKPLGRLRRRSAIDMAPFNSPTCDYGKLAGHDTTTGTPWPFF